MDNNKRTLDAYDAAEDQSIFDSKAFGNRLKSALATKHMRQGELANELGVQDATISAYVNGKILPSIKILCRISAILDKPLDYFFQRPTSISINDLGEVARVISALARKDGLSVKVDGNRIVVSVDQKYAALADYLSIYLEHYASSPKDNVAQAMFRAWNTQELERLDRISFT